MPLSSSSAASSGPSGSYWLMVKTTAILLQGDHLPSCRIPIFGEEFGREVDGATMAMDVGFQDLIVITQSCDLEQNKVSHIALCPIYTLPQFEEKSPGIGRKWEQVRQGRMEGLHLLGSQINADENTTSKVVDFRQIVSLPIDYLRAHAEMQHERFRLQSPYLEHFSQAFARFFMRVGLPSSIPSFNK